ncbi:tRNA (adenosine(37)-N6)-threonylcarbamoyltransferase complex dimerization subunit type 1 TsaB [Paenibacillus tarimensis]
MTEREPLILALDTSTAALAAALVRGSEPLAEVRSLAERNHSVYIVPKLQELLTQTGLTPENLDAIAVGQGPGSYTGMRIAVTVAKTLAWTWDKPVVGISSLEGLAYGASKNDAGARGTTTWYIPIMDARRGQVYTSAFVRTPDGAWTRQAEDGIRLMKEWVDELAGKIGGAPDTPERIVFTGDLSLHEAEAHRLGSESTPDRLMMMPFLMEGRWIAELGRMKLMQGLADEVHALVPNYTQLAEAEAKLQAKSRGGMTEDGRNDEAAYR